MFDDVYNQSNNELLFENYLQVREMNLLRESNMQLREENKHNFEECQVHGYVNYLLILQLFQFFCCFKVNKVVRIGSCCC